MTGIIDYGAGNIRSVENALDRLGAGYVLASDTATLSECDRLVLPGVGEAARAMACLREKNLDAFIRNTRKPLLGICLGMQLLCSASEEGNVECLGIFGTDVRHFLHAFPEGVRLIVIDATQIALEEIGLPITNTTLMGAFAAASGEITLDALKDAIEERFPGKLAETNFAAAKRAYNMVLEGAV